MIKYIRRPASKACLVSEVAFDFKAQSNPIRDVLEKWMRSWSCCFPVGDLATCRCQWKKWTWLRNC